MIINKRKWSLKTRILIGILALIGVIFCCIILAFNYLVNDNIEKNGIRQIENAIQIAESSNVTQKNVNQKNVNQKGGILQKNGTDVQMKSRAEVLIINGRYNLEFPKASNILVADRNKYQAIIEAVKADQYPLGSGEAVKISTEYGEYFMAAVQVKKVEAVQDLYMIFFVDITSNIELAVQINLMLAIILGLAFLLSAVTAIVLARKIAKPVEELSDFAERIGKGDFSKCDIDFSDREIAGLADSMNRSAEQLDRYDKDQKIFFQNASHELRTPLMSIKGYGEAIKYKIMNAESAVDIILEESDKLTEMVEDLLYISKIDNISEDFIKSSCDLREILSNCCITQKARALNKGIEFIYDFDREPVMLECNEKRITRAFLNIIDNGIRYAKSSLIISCKNQDDGVVVSIKDDGEGISEKDAPYVFDRFYKGKTGRNGIGLAIVKSIVEEHDGEIWVENMGNGTRFVLKF